MKKESVTYRKNGEKSYMILSEIRPDLMESYFGQIVLNNYINGILPCSIRWIDGKQEIWMEITDQLSLEQLYSVKEFRRQDLSDFLTQLLQALSEAEKYLLDSSRFCFDPSFLYWDIEKKNLGIAFDFEEESDEGLKALGQFVIEHTMHDDEEAVELAYFFYDLVQEGNVQSSKLKKYLYQKSLEKKKEKTEDLPWENDEYTEIEEKIDNSRALWEQEEKVEDKETLIGWNRKSSIGLLGVVLSLLMCVGFFVIRHFYHLEENEILIWISLSIVMFGLGIFVFVQGIFAKNNETQTIETQTIETQTLLTNANKELYERDNITKRDEDEKTEESYSSEKTVYIGKKELHRQHILIPSGACFRDGKEIKIRSYPFLVGKEKGSVSCILPDKSVSRIHARFLMENEEIYLEDLDSTNGTFVNDLPLSIHEKIRLKVGDYITFGRMEFEFH